MNKSIFNPLWLGLNILFGGIQVSNIAGRANVQVWFGSWAWSAGVVGLYEAVRLGVGICAFFPCPLYAGIVCSDSPPCP